MEDRQVIGHPLGAKVGYGLVGDPLDQGEEVLVAGGLGEGRLAREHVEEGRAERIHVGLLTRGLSSRIR